MPMNIVERILLDEILSYTWDKQVIRVHQHGFVKGRSYLTNSISFCDNVTHFVDEERLPKLFFWTSAQH